ncbi:hypothetical protein HDF26_001254 [Pedobacter cryoconitis]|uniref:hypothetical protein n=1 Tax=Pedobacter cryoconitis TaxID=188932 RepID=UPI0016177C42|nr:hypothetical protein [Pedobacter cryoconitis]MBB6270827.1 hypothetical protein [Pedobacter cryoconitis]
MKKYSTLPGLALTLIMLFITCGIKAQIKKQSSNPISKWACRSCDTLILKPGKPIFIFYNIPAILSDDEFRHVQQLKESDLDGSIDYKFELSALSYAQREWDELHLHFPKEKFNYKYLFRHTYIKVINHAAEVINMLALPDDYKGFIYWGGKAGDKVVKSDKMYQLTELVAQQRKVKSRSGYMIKNEQDSIAIARYKSTFKPSPEAAKLAMFLAVDLNFKGHDLPLQLFDLKGVKEMKLMSDTHNYRNLILNFNEKGQIVKMLNALGTVFIEYKDDAPYLFKDNAAQFQEFSYSGDTVFVANKWNHKMDRYTMAGDFYFKTKSYLLYEPVPFRKELILSENELSKQKNGSAELVLQANNPNGDILDMLNSPAVNEESEQLLTAVSSTKWGLPITLKYKTYYDSKLTELIEEQFADPKGNLILDKIIDGIRRRYIFKMKDGRPVSLSVKTQILSDDGKTVLSDSKKIKTQVVNFSYQYF